MDKLVRVILANRKSLVFIYAILIAFAVNLAMQQRQAVFPDVNFPKATFKVQNGFAPLSEMERIFARPIEALASSSGGVLTYSTKIERGLVELSVSLDAARDFAADFQLLKGKVSTLVQGAPTSNGVPAQLSADLTNSNNFAMLGYSLVSDSAGYLDLRRVVETRIKPALQQVPGVGQIEVIGGSLPEVRIMLDPAKLALYRLTPETVATQITKAGGTLVLGTFTAYGKLVLGFSSTGLTNAEAIAALPIRSGQTSLALSDVADVRMAASYPQTLTSTDQKPSVLFNVFGSPGVDVVSLSAAVSASIDNVSAKLPPTMTVTRWYSLADFIQTSLSNVTNSILIGIAIVSLSVVLFLRDLRASIPVVAAMLVSVILTFIAMDYMGQTLNIMTLAGISAAVGLIVDDAIVAVENVARYHELGHDNETAVVEGTTEVLSPLLSSTLTTVAVFAPLGFLTGITGFLFKASGFVIVASLLISLVMAVTLAPILAYWLMRPSSRPRTGDNTGVIGRGYRRLLSAILKAPVLVVLIAAVVIGTSFEIGRGLPTTYLPQWDEGTFIMDLDAQPGTSREETGRQVAQVENVIADLGIIQTYSRQIGDTALQSEQAHFYMHPKPSGAVGGGSVFQAMDELQTTLETKFPGLNVDLHQILPDHFDGLSGKNDRVDIDVFGANQADLVAAGDAIAAAIGTLPEVAEVKLKKAHTLTQFELALDPGKLSFHNLTRAEVVAQVRTALEGNELGFVDAYGQQAAIRMVYPDRWQQFSPSLADMPVFASDGSMTPLSGVGGIELRNAPDRVTRKQGHLYLSVQVATKTTDLGGNAAKIGAALVDVTLPPGTYALVSGDWKRQAQAFTELRNVFLMAIGAVFTLLLIFFRSYGYSLLILLNTLTSLSFVIFGIWYFQTPFNVPTFMGLISVMGIVVKNGILIMAFLVNNLKKGEDNVQAIIDACLVRARPILMTSTAAILGFLPMALSTGRGGEMMQPFAAAVIYGVLGGLVSSLILLPAMYVLATRFAQGKRNGPSETSVL